MSYDPHFSPRGEDPQRQSPPPALEPAFSSAGMTEGSELPRNIAAALACILLAPGGIWFYFKDRRDRFVRFYALQSIVLTLAFVAIGMAISLSGGLLHFIPLIGGIILAVLHFVNTVAAAIFGILWLLLIVQAYLGRTWEMPILWRSAKKHIPAALL